MQCRWVIQRPSLKHSRLVPLSGMERLAFRGGKGRRKRPYREKHRLDLLELNLQAVKPMQKETSCDDGSVRLPYVVRLGNRQQYAYPNWESGQGKYLTQAIARFSCSSFESDIFPFSAAPPFAYTLLSSFDCNGSTCSVQGNSCRQRSQQRRKPPNFEWGGFEKCSRESKHNVLLSGVINVEMLTLSSDLAFHLPAQGLALQDNPTQNYPTQNHPTRKR